jgi:hypothetical protein
MDTKHFMLRFVIYRIIVHKPSSLLLLETPSCIARGVSFSYLHLRLGFYLNIILAPDKTEQFTT